jgi:hypothetical protein
LRAEVHVAVDDFGVVALLGLEVEQARACVSEAVKGVLGRLGDWVPVIAFGGQAVALERVEIDGLEPAPWPRWRAAAAS